MNCANHPETPAAAYCRTCGKPLCTECRREAQGTIFCEEHVPPVPSSHYTAPPYTANPSAANPWAASDTPGAAGAASSGIPPQEPFVPGAAGSYLPPGTQPAGRNYSASPGLAFLLGLIPGVGAIYNGQYAKGLVHAVIFGILISILDNHPTHGLEPLVAIIMAVWFFYMAFEAYHTARKRRDGERVDEFSSLVDLNRSSSRFPVGAVVLIGLGALLLLDQTDLVPLERLIRFWPVGLILIGVYMLYARMEAGPRAAEVRDERGSR